MRIVVLGYIVRGPYGGLVFHHLQYVIGLINLGYEVLFLEDSDDYPSCSSPANLQLTTDASYGLQFIKQVFEKFDLKTNWAYYDANTNTWYGLSKQKVFSFCDSADAVLNISAVNPLRHWWSKIPNRILIDTDPTFTQIRHLTNKQDKEVAKHHTTFFSFGENIGKQDCKIPGDGFDWKPTRQPVVLDIWKTGESCSSSKWTTVMQWDSYKVREYQGKKYGMKSQSFTDFENLPQILYLQKFELAMGGASATLKELKSKGWDVISALVTTKTPWSYQQYIQQSKGEWSVAKQGYVVSNSGWFSERSASYLASGKPVVVQDTGFSSFLPVGQGLLSFSSLEEAIDELKKVELNYSYHCKKARQIVEEHFNSESILTSLLKCAV
ncbi:MAG: hypothetical protein ABIW34_12025 [Ginsengibacter sp.]